MIRIAVLDRRPAVRAGIEAILSDRPGLAFAGGAADGRELRALLYRARPDVVLLEHDPGSYSALAECVRLKAAVRAPRVVLWVAGVDDDLVVPATLAGADAIVDTAADPRVLLDAVRVVAGGGRVMPAITPLSKARAASRLEPLDRAIFAMRLAGTPAADVAATVGLTPRRLAGRVQAIVAALASREAPAAPVAGAAPELGVRALGEAA